MNANESPVPAAELYDPVTGQWSATGDMTIPRVMHSLTRLPNGKVLAVGGAVGSSTLNSAELYDPANGTWTITAALATARLRHTTTLLLNGKVLVAGGRTLIGPTLSSAELFDTAAPSINSVSAASFASAPLAPESIVAAFGSNLTPNTLVATGLPLPIELAGLRLSIRDRSGIERPAPLFFVSPTQINYQIPPGALNGTAMITVNNGAVGVIEITSVSPGLFSTNTSGTGQAAAVALRVKANGEQVYEAIAQFDAASNKFVPVAIDVSNPAEQVFLLLFGTGFRHNTGLGNVTATVGGAAAEVLFAGAQGDFVGVDQCNLRLPNSLAGRGDVSIELLIDGKAANPVSVRIK